jgi:hypothetical protein
VQSDSLTAISALREYTSRGGPVGDVVAVAPTQEPALRPGGTMTGADDR